MLTNKPSEVFTIRAIRTIIFACSLKPLAQVRINLMPYGLQDCSSGSNQSYPSSHSQARDFSLARYSRIAQVFIDKEVVFSTFACSPCSRRSSYFLASAFPQAEFRLCRHKPLSIFTICFSDDLKLKPFPSGFHRSRGNGAFGLLFVFPRPPPLAFVSRRGGAGGFRCGGLRPAPTMYLKRT